MGMPNLNVHPRKLFSQKVARGQPAKDVVLRNTVLYKSMIVLKVALKYNLVEYSTPY